MSNERRKTKTWNAHELQDERGRKRRTRAEKKEAKEAALVVMGPSGRERRLGSINRIPSVEERATKAEVNEMRSELKRGELANHKKARRPDTGWV